VTLIDVFSDLEDPRLERTKKHSLIDIIMLTICATIAGAEGWDEIVAFGRSKKNWLTRYLELENGIPSADTIRRTISRIKPSEFESRFFKWVMEVFHITEGATIAIDGKTARNKRVKDPVHIVSAWCNSNGGVLLGQVKTDEKSNEITAIPELLKLLEIKGCIITIDAMGCQKEIANQITEHNEAEYILALKENHPTLHGQVQDYFSACDGASVYGAVRASTVAKGHGRLEERIGYISNDTEVIPELRNWPSANAIGLIISRRTLAGVTSEERRYYLLSCSMPAKKFLNSVREHWGIENKLHWVLDVAFKEDGSRINDSIAAENFTIIRKAALMLIKKIDDKNSIKRRIKLCAWDDSYLEKVMKSSI
jgi:predicted transposase YbfD/YdcC